MTSCATRRQRPASTRPLCCCSVAHQPSTQLEYAASETDAPRSGSRLLHRVCELRSVAPSHSSFGCLPPRSARAASRWQLKWIRLKCVTVE